MPTLYDRLRNALPTAIFAPAWTHSQIAHAESELGIRIPDWLRELYLQCGGIIPRADHPPYLLWYEGDAGLIEYNKFIRSLYEDADADPSEIRKILIIGTDGVLDWAIGIDGNPQIVRHDVRSYDRSVLAVDLVEFCAQKEATHAKIRNELYRGREPYRRDPDSPVRCDVDRLMDKLNYDHSVEPNRCGARVGHNWTVDRAINQRSGETGELFIFGGRGIEFQLISRDGNFPFIVKLPHPQAQLTCSVETIDQMIVRIDRICDERNHLIHDALPKTLHNPTIPASKAIALWTSDAAPFDDELNQIAETLCRRDDRRLEEKNRLGA